MHDDNVIASFINEIRVNKGKYHSWLKVFNDELVRYDHAGVGIGVTTNF